MEINGFKIKEQTYKDHKYFAIYLVIDKVEYYLGSLKEGKEFKYIKTVSRKDK